MKFLALILVASVLTGCATKPTPDSLRTSAPEGVFTSDKSPSSLAECILSKWENTPVLMGSRMVASQRQVGDGYQLLLGDSDRLRYLADLTRTNFGSKTKVYVDSMVFSAGQNPMVAAVANCQ